MEELRCRWQGQSGCDLFWLRDQGCDVDEVSTLTAKRSTVVKASETNLNLGFQDCPQFLAPPHAQQGPASFVRKLAEGGFGRAEKGD